MVEHLAPKHSAPAVELAVVATSDGAEGVAPRPSTTGRLDTVFSRGRPALICYLPLGDPAADDELPLLYEECGVDVLEVGVPGGDPYLDGKTIVDSLKRARLAGINSKKASELIGDVRAAFDDIAAVWMTYPPDDPTGLVELVAASGVDAFLIPQPARGYLTLATQLEERSVDFIHFLNHDPLLKDVRQAIRDSRGYVMLQANPGPTGIKPIVLPDNAEVIAMLRRLGLTTPIALGVGIGSPAQAKAAIEMGADGVVIGSLTVEMILKGRNALKEMLLAFREALDGH
jgi:tryptophan synthase alpha chain